MQRAIQPDAALPAHGAAGQASEQNFTPLPAQSL